MYLYYYKIGCIFIFTSKNWLTLRESSIINAQLKISYNITYYNLMHWLFYIFGTWAYEIPIFAKTAILPIWIVFLGWGLNQVCLSVLIQNFIKPSRTATIAGYILAPTALLLSFWTNISLYLLPQEMPTYLFMFARQPYWRCYRQWQFEKAYCTCGWIRFCHRQWRMLFRTVFWWRKPTSRITSSLQWTRTARLWSLCRFS